MGKKGKLYFSGTFLSDMDSLEKTSLVGAQRAGEVPLLRVSGPVGAPSLSIEFLNHLCD